MRITVIAGQEAAKKFRRTDFLTAWLALRRFLLLAALGVFLIFGSAPAKAATLSEQVDEMNRAIAERERPGETGMANSGKVQIFKEYVYGMSPEQVRQMSGAWPCHDPEMPGALCARKPVSFAGTKWQQAFTFDGPGLDQVLLAKENIEPEELLAVFQVLGAENSLVYMTDGMMPFDLIDMARTVGMVEAQDMGSQYLMTALQNGVTLEAWFYPDAWIKRLLQQKAPSAPGALRNAPANVRIVQLAFTNEEDEAAVALIFSTPGQFIRKLGKKNLKERF